MGKVVNAVTKSVPSSGRSSPTSTELTPPVPTTVTPISNSRESTSTTTRPLVADTSPEPSSWISSPEPWTPSEPDLSVNFSDPTTSFSDKPVPVTTGPRVTTPRVLSSSTPSSTSSVRRPKVAIASKVSKLPTLSVVVPAPVWEPSSSPRSERSTPIDKWSPSPSCLPPRSLIPSLSLTTPPSLSINLSRTPIKLCALITRPFTISASEPSSSPPPLMVILTISFLLLSPVSPAASDSPVSSTLISESSLSTSFLPQTPFLHDWFRSPYLQRLPTIQSPHRPRAHPTNVRCQEHDVRFRPQTR